MSQKPKPEIKRLKAEKPDAGASDPWIAIGQVRKTVGLKGWLRVGLLTDFPDRFQPGSQVFVQNRSGETEVATVSEWRGHFTETAIDIKFEGADDLMRLLPMLTSMLVIRSRNGKASGATLSFTPMN